MNTFILNSETSNQPIEQLLRQAQLGGVEVRDSLGNVIAFILSPSDHAKWAYADAHSDLDTHKHEVQQALNRSGGITTAGLLEKAASQAQKDDLAR